MSAHDVGRDESGDDIPGTWEALNAAEKAPREMFTDEMIELGDRALRHSLGVRVTPGDSYYVMRVVAPLLLASKEESR
jgi:hypothetical protein